MGELNRRRRRVWVDGVEYGAEKDAALAAGVSVSSIHEALKAGGRMVKGRMILPKKPPEPYKAEFVSRKRTGALIRYPPGEGPLYQGAKRWT